MILGWRDKRTRYGLGFPHRNDFEKHLSASRTSAAVTGNPGDLLGRFLRHSNVPASILPLYCSRRTGYAGCAAGGGAAYLKEDVV
jgi:hypothetical protein